MEQNNNTPQYKRGDAFWNPKLKRQFIYDMKEEGYNNYHLLISDQGQVFSTNMDELIPFKSGRNKKLDYDLVSNYRDSIDNFRDIFKDSASRQYKDPKNYYKELQDAVNTVNNYESRIKESIPKHRMDDHTKNFINLANRTCNLKV